MIWTEEEKIMLEVYESFMDIDGGACLKDRSCFFEM